ncbi:MAG: 50S ribosomal protein L13 [Candidatus Marsarchaeota archaeon]|nr:50S ribosomal protein L13 [Candidatus Marsarchaeota archaeon]MCL5094749.1 50S ribosomal protein L13 [Candidatus Marsarchaeota archaeon]
MHLNLDKNYDVYDAQKEILGRLGSIVAKELLNGKNIVIINAEKALITGSKKDIIKKYRTRLNLIEKANPTHSAYWSRRPDLLVKRVIRGMLPYRKPSGKAAYRRLNVFIGVPEHINTTNIIKLNIKDARKIFVRTLSINDLSNLLGYNNK